jgi:mono/diheme cytochrome c family protein
MKHLAIVLSLALTLSTSTVYADPSGQPAVDYARDVAPVFAKYCVQCHGAEKQESGLRLDSGLLVLQGGNTGPSVVAGKSAESLLVKAVTGQSDQFEMPPEEPRPTPEEVGLVVAWIDQGALVPAEVTDPAAIKGREHWSFQPVVRRDAPAVSDPTWVKNPIDAFVLARLDQEGIRPSPEADRATLIRRLSLDLLGLPPSPAEVDQFLADTRTDAYEQLVDRLLASPHYGERQARHWLDLARYADSNGFTIDGPRSGSIATG